MGNVELFELCETNPKVQCKECLLYSNQGIVYCTCGHLLKECEASRGILQWTLDLLSIQNYVIEKVRPHGHRFWEDSRTKRHIILPIIWERGASREVSKGFTTASWKIPYFVNLNSNMIELKMSVSWWTNLRRKISPIEWRKKSTFDTERIGGSLSIILAKIGPLRDRSDFNDALSTLHRLHQESGEEQLRPIPFWKYLRWHSSSSSSSSWWQWSDSWWLSWQLTRKSTTEVMLRATW